MRTHSLRRRVAATVAGVAVAAVALTGCGGGGSSSTQSDAAGGGSSSSDATMNIYAGLPTPVVANFNPFSPSRLNVTLGVMFEPVFYYNKVQSGPPTPVLGESREWSEDGTELTIHLKDGVLWSDGEKFSADDVVYTYEYPLNSISGLVSAEAKDDTTVVLTFEQPAFTSEFTILGATPILPEHIWRDVEDPDLFANDEDPVVTGPYVFSTASESTVTLEANPNFREEGKPAVKKLRYLGIGASGSVEDLIETEAVDWVSLFTPDPEGFLSNPRWDYLVAYVNPTSLFTCANADLGCTGPQTDPAVRQAINVAIDRAALNTKAWGGVGGEASPTFAVPGRDDEFISKDVPAVSPQEGDVDAAKKILEEAGWTLGSDGVYEKDGQKLQMTIMTVDGWIDTNAAARLMAEQLEAAGMKLDYQTAALSEVVDSRNYGKFNLIINGIVGSSIADPWVVYRNYFSTDATSPVGEALPAGLSNATRYSNPIVDAAVKAASETNDVEQLKEQYAIIQEQIVQDLPYVPIIQAATQVFVNSEDYTGWPTEDDMYAFAAPWENYAAGVILTKVEPK